MENKKSELVTMKIGSLLVDTNYQRKLDMKHVKNIVDNYCPPLLGTFQVSKRDGKFYVFDGQHTKKAIEMKFNDPNYPVSCRVYSGLTEEEEAELFYRFNTSKKAMNAISIIKAQSFYGDEGIRYFLQCTRNTGFTIDPMKPRKCRYSITAIKKARDCFFALGSEAYMFMLLMLKNTWGGEPWSVSSNVLSGMTTLLRVFGKEIKAGRFEKQMAVFTDDDINREASRFYNLSLPYRFAWALGTLYNKKGGKGSLDLKKLNFVNL